MDEYYHFREATPLIVSSINAAIAEQMKVLLETKHLYQKVSVDIDAAFQTFEGHIYGDDLSLFKDAREMSAAAEATLVVGDRELFTEEKNGQRSPTLMLLLKSIKLFCAACESKEAFRPIWWSDATDDLRKPAGRERVIGELPRRFQLFTLLYQCQRCIGVPQAFLVRREGWQFHLHGRSPFEEIEVPAYVPKPERSLYRDAIIAAHAGKTLAALFYLRAFIEQFARRLLKLQGRVTGDQLMEAYTASLPEKQRDHMPSLKEWYEKLSVPIHAAQEDAETFENARDAIEMHFDFRRIFRITEP